MKTSSYVYPLCGQNYGGSKKDIALIPHKQMSEKMSEKMIAQIQKEFQQIVHKDTSKNIPIFHGLKISELYEIVLQTIAHVGYTYNRECFISINFNNAQNKDHTYQCDETLFAQSSDDALNYYTKFCEVYNPLCMLNPLGVSDTQTYATLNALSGQSTIIGCDSTQTLPEVDLVVLRNISQSSDISPSANVKRYIQIQDSDVASIGTRDKSTMPDFIELPYGIRE